MNHFEESEVCKSARQPVGHATMQLMHGVKKVTLATPLHELTNYRINKFGSEKYDNMQPESLAQKSVREHARKI